MVGLFLNLQPLEACNKILLLLQLRQLIPNILIHVIRNILPVVNLRHGIVLPLIRQNILLLNGEVEDASTSILLLQLLESGPFGFNLFRWDHWGPFLIIPRLGLGNIDASEYGLLIPHNLIATHQRIHILAGPLLENHLTGHIPQLIGSLLIERTHLHILIVIVVDPAHKQLFVGWGQLLQASHVGLVQHNHNILVFE